MALTRVRSPSNKLKTVVALLLICVSSVRGFPLQGKELDSAVEGVQKYLESSGFPKMTRGEVLDFLDDFSRTSRVSRSGNVNSGRDSGAPTAATPTSAAPTSPAPTSAAPTSPAPASPAPAATHRAAGEESASATSGPSIPEGESPLNYGYPMSASKRQQTESEPSARKTAATAKTADATGDKKTDGAFSRSVDGRRGAPKKSIVPSADPNAYSKFKRIPEARDLKIDDDMRDFLGNFGLLDPPRPGKSTAAPPQGPRAMESQRRVDDAAVTESVDERLLKSVLAETGTAGAGANASGFPRGPLFDSISKSDHVFNPTGSDVKTVDINRIAKIVENIRLLTDDNDTVALPRDVFLKKFENITADIGAIDQPAAAGDGKPFGGYEVFFDDDSVKEVDSDLPESPVGPAAAAAAADATLVQAHNPPDPLSTDELQQLLDKNKNDVKRQEPARQTVGETADETTGSTTLADEPRAVSTTSEAAAAAAADASSTPARTDSSPDSSSEATSSEVTSDAAPAADPATTAAADANPSLSELAESFGGGETASSPPTAEDEVTTAAPNRPRNGLYFYVDWNSFLTVNAGQKNQVNLRFAPKAGNPNHFLKVNVP